MTGVSDPARLRKIDELGGLPLLRKPLTNEMVVDAVRRAAKRRADRNGRVNAT